MCQSKEQLNSQIWALNLPGSEKVILLALVELSEGTGKWTGPMLTLSRMLNCDPTYLVKRVQRLKIRRAFETTDRGRGDGGHFLPLTYQLTLDQCVDCEPVVFLSSERRGCILDELLQEYEFFCPYCHLQGGYQKGPDGRAWTIDRIIPGAKGGEYVDGNMTLSCATCNHRKSDKAA